MNEIARIVHDLVTGKSVDLNGFADLSPEARAALQDLQVRLNRQLRNGVADSANNVVANDWAAPPPSISSATS